MSAHAFKVIPCGPNGYFPSEDAAAIVMKVATVSGSYDNRARTSRLFLPWGAPCVGSHLVLPTNHEVIQHHLSPFSGEVKEQKGFFPPKESLQPSTSWFINPLQVKYSHPHFKDSNIQSRKLRWFAQIYTVNNEWSHERYWHRNTNPALKKSVLSQIRVNGNLSCSKWPVVLWESLHTCI